MSTELEEGDERMQNKMMLKKMKQGITLLAMTKTLEGDRFNGKIKGKEVVNQLQFRKTKTATDINTDHW